MDSRQIIEQQALETKKNEEEKKNNKEILKYNEEENKFVLGLVKALFLLILALSGNFLAETLSCQTQKIFQNMWAKHIVLFFLIYFTIDVVDRGDVPADPGKQLLDALALYIAFHLFTKMDFHFTMLVFSALCAIYILGNYRKLYDYKKEQLKKNPKMKELVFDYEKKDKLYGNIQMYLYYASIAGVIIGSTIYLFRKKAEYGKKFSYHTFFNGVQVCKGLQ